MPIQSAPGEIKARAVSRSFGAKQALSQIDLDLGPGGIVGLLGPNGSGKSTLLRVLTGLVRLDQGEVSLDGEQLAGDGTNVRKRCTYSPGEIGLYGEMRAGTHLDWLLRGRPREARAHARRIASELELPLKARVRSFSHGMKRQLLFAAAMGPSVRVRILDEISEGLDPSKRGAVLERMVADARSGTTILLSSHHLGEVESVCQRYMFLSGGKILRDEDAAHFRDRARRLVHLEFPALDQAARRALETWDAALGVRECKLTGTRCVIELKEPDPRPLLAALAARTSLPAPREVRFGELSLAELYRDLYGVEAV